MMGGIIFIVLVGALASAVIAVLVSGRAVVRRRLTPPPDAARAQLVAAHLDALDQRLASGQVSQADYAAERNRLLGLPAPEQR